MNRLRNVAALILVLAVPLLAADPLYGTWKMRKSGDPHGLRKQIVKVEPDSGGTRFSYDIELASGTPLSYYYITKLDGAAVPAYSSGQEIMKIRVTRVGPNEFDATSVVPGTTTKFRTTISPDGKSMVTDGTIQQGGGKTIPSHVVFDRVN